MYGFCKLASIFTVITVLAKYVKMKKRKVSGSMFNNLTLFLNTCQLLNIHVFCKILVEQISKNGFKQTKEEGMHIHIIYNYYAMLGLQYIFNQK